MRRASFDACVDEIDEQLGWQRDGCARAALEPRFGSRIDAATMPRQRLCECGLDEATLADG